MAARRDLVEHLAASARVVAGGENFVRLDNIDQVMRNTAALSDRQLRRPDVEMAKHLQRVAADDLAVECLRHIERERTLAGPGGSQNCNQRALRRVWDCETGLAARLR